MTGPLARRLQERAAHHPERRAFVFLGEGNCEEESLTNAQLYRLARLLARDLARRAAAGDRVLLMFPSGLAFVVAFFACHYAGLVPVPVVPPAGHRVRDAVAAVTLNCRPVLVLVGPAFEAQARMFFAEHDASLAVMVLDLPQWLARPDAVPDEAHQAYADTDAVAFIQYTSGSTSMPKGVVVTHRNLLANLEMMATAFGNDADSTHVGWAPLYHDMGLIANVLQPFYVGALSVLMSPRRFSREPWLWLRAIHTYRARVSGGPNFAYDLCVQRRGSALAASLDLSCWQLAFNSAEPVRAETLEAFAKSFTPAGFEYRAFYPCYGLADATLLVSGGAVRQPPVLRRFSKRGLECAKASQPVDETDVRALVGAGNALAGELLVIVDPQTSELLSPGQVGEIWAAGAHVPARYWAASDEVNAQAFQGRLHQFPGSRFLRTGDLGFLDAGELFITGRRKDMFIVRGRNIYPQDVERVAQAAAPGLRTNANAAFRVVQGQVEAVALIQEIERTNRRADTTAIAAAIRRAVFAEFDITLADVVIAPPGTVPMTSSGKVRRTEVAQRYRRGDLLGRKPQRIPGA